MRICLLAPASITHTVRWANTLVERGHSVHLLTMHPADLDIIDTRVNIHRVKIPAPIGYYLNTLELKRYLNKIKPDVLHVHYASGYGTLARLVNFSPTVLSVWGSDVFLFPEQNQRSKKMLQKNLINANQITSTSYAMKKQTERFVTPLYPIKVIPFGINSEVFKPEVRKSPNQLVIGTVKKLEKVYGIYILLEAITRLIVLLQEKGYNEVIKRLRVNIVGSGSELENLKQLTNRLGISEIVEFVGAIPNEAVPYYINQMDIYCAFSRSESFGVAVLEASSCAVPVVASAVGGLPEVVQQDVTGYIVDYQDLTNISEILLSLSLDNEKRNRLGYNGRKFVKEHYDWNYNVEQMETTYKEVINRRLEGWANE